MFKVERKYHSARSSIWLINCWEFCNFVFNILRTEFIWTKKLKSCLLLRKSLIWCLVNSVPERLMRKSKSLRWSLMSKNKIFPLIELSIFFIIRFSFWPFGINIGDEVEVCWLIFTGCVTVDATVVCGVEISVVDLKVEWEIVVVWTGNNVGVGWMPLVVYICAVGRRVWSSLFWNDRID